MMMTMTMTKNWINLSRRLLRPWRQETSTMPNSNINLASILINTSSRRFAALFVKPFMHAERISPWSINCWNTFPVHRMNMFFSVKCVESIALWTFRTLSKACSIVRPRVFKLNDRNRLHRTALSSPPSQSSWHVHHWHVECLLAVTLYSTGKKKFIRRRWWTSTWTFLITRF